jgi:hypothetical protein
MPGLVHASGQADAVYPLDQLSQEITRRVLQNRAVPAVSLHNPPVVLESRSK